MPQSRFVELVEPDHLRQLFAAHFAENGMPAGLMDADGKLLVNIGWHDACRLLHGDNGAVVCGKCHQGTSEVQAALASGHTCEFRCRHGLCDFGIPIIVGGDHLATLLFGQFYYENDDPIRDGFPLDFSGKESLPKAVFYQNMKHVQRFPHSAVGIIRRQGTALARLLADLAAKNLRLAEEVARNAALAASLGESQRHFQEALQASQKHVIYRRNVHGGGYDYISPAIAEIVGVSQEEMLADGQRIVWERMPPEDRDRALKKVERAYREQWPTLSLEFRIRQKDGNDCWFSDTGTILYDAQGRPEAHIGVAQDVTRRRMMETELAETKAILEAAFAENPAGMLLVEAKEHRILMLNNAFRKLAGLDPQSPVPARLENTEVLSRWQLLHPDGTPVPLTERPLIRALRNKATPVQEYRLRRADGTELWIEARGTPIHNPDSGVMAGLLIIEDITARKREEEEQQRQAQQMVQSQKMESLGFLAGGIAHDFNNLLMTIFGNLDLVAAEIPGGSPLHANLRDMRKASRRAADLCSQMLAYSGKGKYVVQVLSLSKIVEEMREIIEAAVAQQATLRYHLADDLPAVTADGPQMQQIVMNLILNAVEAVEAGQKGVITLRTSAVRLTPTILAGCLVVDAAATPGNYVCLEISDNGCGMDKKTMDRMFDPFFSTKFTGRGLGLAAVQGIVRSHKGAIDAVSELGKGSTFRVYLPIAAAECVAETDAPAKSRKKWRGTGTVLLVDDEAAVRTTTTRMLEMLGLNVIACDSGARAVKALADTIKQKKRPPEEQVVCAILDLGLTGMDETQTLAELRQLSPSLHVLVASGYSKETALARLKGEDPSGILQKPYGLDALADKLRQLLG